VVSSEIREAYELAAREPVLDSRLQKFERAMTQWHPVMRHFFTEKQKEPSAWFSMRLAYARSLATTSMIGHVIGLGDRHVSNILIDTKSGELVHIDLGIAFEQVRGVVSHSAASQMYDTSDKLTSLSLSLSHTHTHTV
jgi:serine-protein kinase ATM